MSMKALSIRQPWAWLIANGIKNIENRNWSTDFRGEFLIHASKTFDHEGYKFVKNHFHINIPKSFEYDLGGIIGKTELIDCVTQHDSKWFFGKYGFVLINSRPINFREVRGMQSFFDVKL